MSSTEEFNWEDFDTKGFGEGYSKEQRAQMEAMYSGTLNEITEKEVIKGVVVGVNDKDVIINIGFKSDGLVPLSEFRDIAGIKPGDEVEVYIEEQENALGQLILSRKKSKNRSCLAGHRKRIGKRQRNRRSCEEKNQGRSDRGYLRCRGFLAWFSDRCEAYQRF